jgi:glutathione S-transferase
LYNNAKKIPQQSREKLIDTLNVLESLLVKSKWFAGDDITIADFSILGTITTVKVS